MSETENDIGENDSAPPLSLADTKKLDAFEKGTQAARRMGQLEGERDATLLFYAHSRNASDEVKQFVASVMGELIARRASPQSEGASK